MKHTFIVRPRSKDTRFYICVICREKIIAYSEDIAHKRSPKCIKAR